MYIPIFGAAIILIYGIVSLSISIVVSVRVKSFIFSTVKLVVGEVDQVSWMKRGSSMYSSLGGMANSMVLFCFIFLCYSSVAWAVYIVNVLGFSSLDTDILPPVWVSISFMVITLSCAAVGVLAKRRLDLVDKILTGEIEIGQSGERLGMARIEKIEAEDQHE